MRLVTLAMAVYGQPKMLDVWFKTLRSYPKDLWDQMELIIVDDCGTPPAMIPKDIQNMLPCRLFRVLEDIHWNQPGARNLALEHMTTKMVLFVDPDMIFPMAMMRKMLEVGAALGPRRIIRFSLKHRTGTKSDIIDMSSPNTWFMQVADFKAIKGYDEDFSGHKGWSDVQLLDVMRSAYRVHHSADLYADFYGVNEVEDAAVVGLDRSTVHNKKLRVYNTRVSKQMGGWVKFSKRPVPKLRFKWEEVNLGY